MSIKILTKSGEEVTAIDDARAFNFDAGNKSGIVKGALNEGKLFAVASNVIAIDSCELRISGHRIIIDTAESITMVNRPSTATRYSIIAEVIVSDISIPSFRLFIQPANVELIQQNLYKTLNGKGTYQLKIGNFTLGTDGNISDIVRVVDIISGGGSGAVADIEFNVTTKVIASGLKPEVNVDYNEDTKKYDMEFALPEGSGTNVTVNGVVQKNFDADSKVDKVEGKELSSNDYTNEDKNKLASLSKVTVDAELSTTSTNAVQNKAITSKINEISLSLQNTSNKANSNEQSLSGLSQNINLLNTNKANNDASNLSELNVTAWKEKLNIGGGLPLGLLIPSTCVQNDAGLHYADGSELMFGGIYDAFCRYVSNNRSRFPVVDLATYNQKISTYGQCGSYVITDTYVKLPRIVEFTASNNGGQQIGSEELDSFKSHNHTITKSHPFNTSASGNYTSGTSVDGEDTANKVTTTELTGGNETKPKNVRYPYYIVVGTVTKTDIEVDINKYISDLNNLSNQVQNKAQSDLSNVSNTTLKNKALGLTTLWEGSITSTGTFSLSQSFLNFNFLYFWGRNSGNEYASWIVSTENFNSSTSTYPYDCGNNTKDANRYVNLYKSSNTSIAIKSIGSMTLLGVYGL